MRLDADFQSQDTEAPFSNVARPESTGPSHKTPVGGFPARGQGEAEVGKRRAESGGHSDGDVLGGRTHWADQRNL